MLKKLKTSLSPLHVLNTTQFLSAFADSAIIIIIAFMIKKSFGLNDEQNPYIFLVETFFLFSYVIFAPFVGTFADRNAKSKVLFVGNSVKTIGALLIILGVNPAFCYGLIGVGAAIYGPGKYGILKELTTDRKQLLDANGKIEGFTILAIIIGTVAGGFLSGNLVVGEIFCLVIYIISVVLALNIPANDGNRTLKYGREATQFIKDLKKSFKNLKLNFTLTGSASFWMISVVIKNGLIIWIPVHLGIKGGFPQSLIIGMTAIGIVIGSLLAKKYTSIEKFYRANIYGFIVAALAIVFPMISGHNLFDVILTCIFLLGMGVFAGMFIIPLNATMQDEGHQTLGVGKTIAIQNFTDNCLMLFGSYSVYLLNKQYGFSVMASLIIFGFVFALLICYLSIISKKIRIK
ncbi:lysophospholipid transporter LplT [Neobacillus massiliamazoniensis]|uniref:Lysophospholipid transporter LplT n=1 Tax=Neobacillus massiliamazoniensis TaxID=1499688 RepID=A0A0U1NXE5_9BACI|nr:lysophospholipid transporter LplT [Neobacillus massiliamazoniensis]CRK82699.1 Lysophospholipid transporter LplT [Neobacillus massiliamazoniensis]